MDSDMCIPVQAKVPRIVLAEDRPTDVMLVRMALKKTPPPCDLHVLADGEVLAVRTEAAVREGRA